MVWPPLLSLQDAFDAVGYFHLALAAALEDRANPEALYVVYMKLAEIHGHHLPDADLCQVYRDRAQSLKRVLAGERGTAAAGEDNMEDVDAEPGHKMEEDSDADVERTESLAKRNGTLTSMPEKEKCEDNSFLRTCAMHEDAEETFLDINSGDMNRREDHNMNGCDTDGSFVDASGSETETFASQSCSDSIFTESFDTAKEQISDSSSSTDTLQPHHNQSDHRKLDLDAAHRMNMDIAPNHMTRDSTRHTDPQNRDSDIEDEQKTCTKEKDSRADPVQSDVTQSDADRAGTVNMDTEEAISVDTHCEQMALEDT